jgi:S-adenosylmethionine synthetase
VSISVNDYGTSSIGVEKLEKAVRTVWDLRPARIVKEFDLLRPIYSETAAYGHMGRTPETVTKTFSAPGGDTKTVTVDLFTWEKLDYVAQVKAAFGI